MSLTIDWTNDDKRLYSDNILVRRTKDMLWYFSIYISDKDATVTRYCVPGRCDDYSFTYVPGGCGIGDRVTYFSDPNWTLKRAMKQLERDLNKKQVKELIAQALAKVPRSRFNLLLEALK